MFLYILLDVGGRKAQSINRQSEVYCYISSTKYCYYFDSSYLSYYLVLILR